MGEKNITVCVKSFKVYKESNLSENEKNIELERAIEARMQGFDGDGILKKHHIKNS